MLAIALAAAVAASAPVPHEWNWAVVGMAFGGTVASFAYGARETSRKKLFGLVIANTFIATMGVVLLPAYFGWAWVSKVAEPPLAAMIAFSARFIIPVAVELAPQWIGKLTSSNVGSKTTSGDAP